MSVGTLDDRGNAGLSDLNGSHKYNFILPYADIRYGLLRATGRVASGERWREAQEDRGSARLGMVSCRA